MESIWTETCAIPPRDALSDDTEAEVAVIAAALQKAGRRVVVLEANRIAGGQTRGTTAKITAQHGAFASRLIQTFGEERAKRYVAANLDAVEAYRTLIRKEHIDCEFEEKDAYLYGDDAERLERETEAEARLGLPASFLRDPDVPDHALAAVRVERQAQFHPLKFLRAVSEPLTVYEHTPVQSVEDHVLITGGGRVRAEHIVFACHYPFVNFPGLYFARMHQERSYVLALENAAAPDGMWVGADDGGYSFRACGGLLLLGGGAHRTGENHGGGRYGELRRRAAEWFPDSREAARWSALECMPADGVPYIGRYAFSRPSWYVATGFQKWGMTSSMAAARLLRDLICGRENPYAEVFDPGRLGLKAVSGVASEGRHAAKGLAKRVFQAPAISAARLPDSRGGVVFLRGKKVGAYKDERGSMHAVDIRCPHLGCQVEWNPDERSWDCPCHGSRFNCRGELISGPAREGLRR